MFLEDLKKQLHGEPQPLFIGEETAFRSAITIPLVKIDDEWHVLFEVRALSMRKQPGDISFPGGKIDATDASPLAAALRETHEELGVDIEKISVLSALSPYIASPTFVVYPFVVTIECPNVLTGYHEDEVEEVFTVPVEWLLNHQPYMHLVSMHPTPDDDFPYEKIAGGADYKWGTRVIEEWFYEYGDYIIWGLTARILKHFIMTVKGLPLGAAK